MTRILFDDLGYDTARILALDERDIPGPELDKLLRIIPRLISGVPLQYILGYTWFYGRRFRVASQVLIPRPETEELVDRVIRSCRFQQPSILDIGTGSGCIAVTLSLNIPGAMVTATDISVEALEMARVNAAENDARVTFLRDDVFHPSALTKETSFDIIISNPPYVRNSEKAKMQKNVLDHEPAAALFVNDADPLIFYRSIHELATHHLRRGGILWLEINEALGAMTADLFGPPLFTQTMVLKDMQGKERFIKTLRA